MHSINLFSICLLLVSSCFAQENEFRGELSLDSEVVEWPIGESVRVDFTTSWPSVWLGAWEDDNDSVPVWLFDDAVPNNGLVILETQYPEGVELFTNAFRLWVEEVNSEGSSTGLSFSSTQIRAVNASSTDRQSSKTTRPSNDTQRPVAASSTVAASTSSARSRQQRGIALGVGVGVGAAVLILALGSWGIMQRRRKRVELMEVMRSESEMRQPLTT